MIRKRIMVVGPSGCGKTTLINALNDCYEKTKVTQNIIYGKNTIDIPGAYLENPWMYSHIIAASQHASHVLILIDQSKCQEVYSHGFAKAFRCDVIGVISKCDLMIENEKKCLKQLKIIGIKEPYFHISVPNKVGIDTLKKYLSEKDKSKGGQ